MLVIRLLRAGKKHQPFFQIVVTDKKNPPRGGRFVEKVGYLNPLTKELSIKKERIQYWLSKGAKASERVHNLLIKEKVIEGESIPVHKEKKKETGAGEKPEEKKEPEKEEDEKEEKPAEKPETEDRSEEKKEEEKKPEEGQKEEKKSEEPKPEDKEEPKKEDSKEKESKEDVKSEEEKKEEEKSGEQEK